jgi:EVE domain
MAGHWIAVASGEHVRRGRAAGFMQVCHGKAAPLRRIGPGDGIAYYSPAKTCRGADRLQAFTAIGTVRDGEPYSIDMGGGLRPWRRDVDWAEGRDAAIAPLLECLEFTAGRRNWGYPFRFGLFAVGARDFGIIAEAMGTRFAAGAEFRQSLVVG